MKLKDFDFRIWDNEDNLYLEQKYTKRLNCYEAKGYAVGLAGDGYTKLVYEIVTGVESTQDGLNDYEFVQNLGENKWEIELFTGLYDKNGKKIYEGDILYYFKDYSKGEVFKYQVLFKEGAFYLFESYDGFVDDEDLISEFDLKELQVVGNIHENKELLK